VAGPVSCYAVDAPQGLPESGSKNRRCDREAGTPTNKLPASRKELEGQVLFKGLIEMGIETFWSLSSRPDIIIHGIGGGKDCGIVVIETYPRKTAKMLGLAPLPSKKKDPIRYIHHVWGFLKSAGYGCPSVLTPAVDQVDAMLCAIAAQAFMAGSPCWKAMGSAPFIYPGDNVLREGFIVCPSEEWLKTVPG
jgi:predicted nuclease with RNAse H fold